MLLPKISSARDLIAYYLIFELPFIKNQTKQTPPKSTKQNPCLLFFAMKMNIIFKSLPIEGPRERRVRFRLATFAAHLPHIYPGYNIFTAGV